MRWPARLELGRCGWLLAGPSAHSIRRDAGRWRQALQTTHLPDPVESSWEVWTRPRRGAASSLTEQHSLRRSGRGDGQQWRLQSQSSRRRPRLQQCQCPRVDGAAPTRVVLVGAAFDAATAAHKQGHAAAGQGMRAFAQA
eukprot:scaffold119431_cov78-Phaeocystis_antarctica.AAC.1